MHLYVRSLLAGAATGIRSTTALTALTLTAPRGATRAPDSLLSRPAARAAVPLLAVAESVLDKLPGTPPRTALPPLLGRLAAGVGAGVVLARRLPPEPVFPDGSGSAQRTVATPAQASPAAPVVPGPVVVAALLAAGATVATTLLGLRWRTLAQERFGTDAVGSFLEDAAGIALAATAARA